LQPPLTPALPIPSKHSPPGAHTHNNPHSYRNTLALLGGAGIAAVAPDWIGHGDSAKPQKSKFDYTEAAYVAALGAFVEAINLQKPLALVVQVGVGLAVGDSLGGLVVGLSPGAEEASCRSSPILNLCTSAALKSSPPAHLCNQTPPSPHPPPPAGISTVPVRAALGAGQPDQGGEAGGAQHPPGAQCEAPP